MPLFTRRKKIRSYIYRVFCALGLSSIMAGCQSGQPAVQAHPFRLKPGEDLLLSIQDYAKRNQLKAGWIATCAGSLTDYSIRMANQSSPDTGSGHFEITGLTGTISENGVHLHISISDSTGKTIGGHLVKGCKIYTTAEMVLMSTADYRFVREKDGTTPWEELQVAPVKN